MRTMVLWGLLLFGLSGAPQAALIDRGGGMIYDDVLNITWLMDADLIGVLNWDAAVAAAENLNIAGIDDWRLASMDVNMDGNLVDCNVATELACRDNELGYMFYQNLGGNLGDALNGDQAPFINIQLSHWSGTEYVPDPAKAWFFGFAVGDQNFADKSNPSGTWAVRSGDVDSDGDGVYNNIDNCINVANAGQVDSDGDGHGNVCDADFDNNCITSFPDLSIMQAGFFTIDAVLDLDSSGGPVSFADLAIMQGLFFLPPGPSASGSLCNPSLDPTIVGVAQKGPFVENSSITLYALQSDGSRGSETAEGFAGPNGQINVSIAWEGPTEVEITGGYLDETTGEVVQDQLTLSTVVNAVDGSNQASNINFFSHLAAMRAKSLMSSGEQFEAAVAQANEEVSTKFAFRGSVTPDELDLTTRLSDSPADNANLLLASASIVSASLTQLDLSTIADDFSADGAIDDLGQSTFDQVRASAIALDLEAVRQIMIAAGFPDTPGFADLDFVLPEWIGEPIQLKDDAYILSSDELGGLVSVSPDLTDLRFDPSSGVGQSIAVGDVIVGEPADLLPGGILRRVISVTNLGQEIQIATEAAGLDDVIESGSLYLRAPLRSTDVESVEAGPGVTLAETTTESRTSEGCDPLFLEMVSVQRELITVSGKVASCATFFLDYKFPPFGTKSVSVRLELINTLGVTVSTSGEIGVELDPPLELFRARLRPKVFVFGIVPISIGIEVPVVFDAIAVAEAGMSASLAVSRPLMLQADYANGAWSSDFSRGPETLSTALNTELRFTLGAGITVAFEPTFNPLPVPLSAATRLAARVGVDAVYAENDYPQMQASGDLTASWSILVNALGVDVPEYSDEATVYNQLFFMSEPLNVAALRANNEEGLISWRDDFQFPSESGTFNIYVAQNESELVPGATSTATTMSPPQVISNLEEGVSYFVAVSATDSESGLESQFSAIVPLSEPGPGGGIVFYLEPGSNGAHGLEAAIVDQSDGTPWGCNVTTTGASNTAVGSGAVNTQTIIDNACSSVGNEAAEVAAAYTGGGFNDWFLPSKDELHLMYQNIGQGAANQGGFADDFYWSSSEFNNGGAWMQRFGDGFQVGGLKNGPKRVRAIRAF